MNEEYEKMWNQLKNDIAAGKYIERFEQEHREISIRNIILESRLATRL